MKKMRKVLSVLTAALAVFLISCGSTNVDGKDPEVANGIKAWNSREPESARAYWTEIKDSATQKKYLNYITLYNAGNDALESTDAIKATNESKLLSACNTALTKFSAIDEPLLSLPASTKDKGSKLTAVRIDNLLAAGKVNEAGKMQKTAVKVYGTSAELDTTAKEVAVCESIASKKANLLAQAEKAAAIEDFDAQIAAYNDLLAKCTAAESEVNTLVKNSGVADTNGVSTYAKTFKKVRQDVAVQREASIREKAYDYKDAIGEEFARQPEGTGSGKNGEFTLDEILAHYKSVEANINTKYDELIAFSEKYPKEVSKDIINDINAQKNDLQAKIAQINKEIAYKKEVESRGKTVMPLMIGLFNPAPGSTKESQKSRPAKFSATKQKGDEYWWGMVSIKSGEMNDLVITLKDNRNVRVFNQNTHSGKDIEKKGIKDLVSKANKVGNSWPVLNAGKALGSDKYFFEIQKGKTDSYSGEVVVYSSFITRSR
ncbi:hypothetical protein [Treponema sp.]|uniref:hypothetical protein n=1 Tax=Treponema sp. TaxID=166 RepID=UPI0038901783